MLLHHNHISFVVSAVIKAKKYLSRNNIDVLYIPLFK